MRPILLVGEAPASDPRKSNLHACLALRASRVSISRGAISRLSARHPWLFEFVRHCEHTNVLPFWPGYDRRGSAFPMSAARPAAALMARTEVDRVAVLLAGRRVAAAFEIHPHHRGLGYFERVRELRLFGGAPVFMVPHPSGVNRWWNVDTNRTRARHFLEKLALEGDCE